MSTIELAVLPACSLKHWRFAAAVCALALLAACVSPQTAPTRAPVATDADFHMVNRLTWGVNSSSLEQYSSQGFQHYLESQLHPRPFELQLEQQALIGDMKITKTSLADLMEETERQRKALESMTDDTARKQAQQTYQQDLNHLAREAATRHVLRAIYSPNQIQEQMTWFWMNHFNVFLGKRNIRAMIGDYEESAIRPLALGKFRDLLGAVVTHPAMLRYLDNEQNAVGHINENLARELMELHTLGVDGGYTQHDVQELARVLTGVGVYTGTRAPRLRWDTQGYYVRRGLFEFNPNRHDFGPKVLLGKPITGVGLQELDNALDRLASHPSTARFLSRKLATYWLSDEPAPSLVNAMAKTFESSHGDIAATLKTLFVSSEFAESGVRKFKDPMHFAISAIRLAYDQKPILNTGPILFWLNRMGEPLYGRPTPDGYPLTSSAWTSSGQMSTRFEVAKAIGRGSAGLFRSDNPQQPERAAFPQLANALYYQALSKTLSPATAKVLEQAATPQEWNTLLLASPEMMYR